MTIGEARRKARNLFDTLNAKTAKVASCLMCTFPPKLECGDYYPADPFGNLFSYSSRYKRSAELQMSPANSGLNVESSGVGYPWYTGSYRTYDTNPAGPWYPATYGNQLGYNGYYGKK